MWDLADSRGQRAVVTRKQRVRFLAGEAGVITGPVWGDGRQFQRYEITGAKRLGVRREGPRDVLLLGLDGRPGKDSRATLVARRTIHGGFLGEREYFETLVERPTKRLLLRVLFPRQRPPREAFLVEAEESRQRALPVRIMADGRARLSWSCTRPKVNTIYSLRWAW